MFDKSKPMELGDIFSISFNLIKETLVRNIIIASVFMIPAGIFMSYGLHSFFLTTVKSAANASAHNVVNRIDNDQLMNIIGGMAFFYFSLTIYGLALLATHIGITKIGGEAMEGKKTTLKEAFSKIFSITYLKCIGQKIVLEFVLAAIIGIAILMGIIAGMMHNTIFTLIAVLLIMGAVVYMIFLFFKWYFSFLSIVSEDKGVFESFTKSFYLVKNYWWRTVGIIILVGILAQFAVSVITTPLSFLFMWNFISKYFTMAASGMQNNDPTIVMEMMKSFGFGFGLVIVISALLSSLISPLFKIVIYFDLRIRKNEFTNELPEAREFSFE